MHAAGWMGFVGGGLPANARRGGRASATAAAETRWLVLRKKRKPDVWVHWGRSVTGAGAWTSGASAFVGARASLRGAGRVATRLSPRVASTPGTHWIVCGTGDAASRGPRSDPRDAQGPPSPSADASSAVVQNGQMEWSNAATPASGPWHPDRHLEGADTQLDAKYRAWRIRTFYSIFLGYAFFYFTRNSFTYTAPALRAALGLSLGQLGIIVSVFPLAYGFSKLLLGIAADRFSTRLFLSSAGHDGVVVSERHFPGLWRATVRQTAHQVVQQIGTRHLVGRVEHLPQHRRLFHPVAGGLLRDPLRLAVRHAGARRAGRADGVLSVEPRARLAGGCRLPPIEVYRDDYADPADKAPAKGTDAAAAAAAPSNRPANKFIDVLRNPYLLVGDLPHQHGRRAAGGRVPGEQHGARRTVRLAGERCGERSAGARSPHPGDSGVDAGGDSGVGMYLGGAGFVALRVAGGDFHVRLFHLRTADAGRSGGQRDGAFGHGVVDDRPARLGGVHRRGRQRLPVDPRGDRQRVERVFRGADRLRLGGSAAAAADVAGGHAPRQGAGGGTAGATGCQRGARDQRTCR
eukprot:ctg_70.g32